MNLDPKTVLVSSLGSPKELMIQSRLFRKIKTVGLLHSSAISLSASSIAEDLKAQGVEVIDFPVAKQEDISAVFEGAQGKIQALVILPESLTQNPDVIRFMVTQSVSNNILPLSFSENMVSSGIFFAVFYPTDVIGKKGAQIVKEIVLSQKIPGLRLQTPESSSSALNRGGLQAFKLKIPTNMKIGVIYE
jgi:putative tryptophan/tyrosine transport system substrate-binding protein